MRNAITAVFLIALLFRLGYLALVPTLAVCSDADQYDSIGWNIASGEGFSMVPGLPTAERAPLYPFLLASVYKVFGHSHTAARIVQTLIGAGTCVVVFFIALRLFDARIALAAGLITAVYPVFASYSCLLLSETLFTFLFLSSILLFLRGIDKGEMLSFLFSGAALGLATLTRPTTVLFPAAFLLSVIVLGRRGLFFRWCVLFLAFVAVLLPWSVRNYSTFHTVLPVATGASISVYATGYMLEGNSWEEGVLQVRKKWDAFAASGDQTALEPHIAFDRALKSEGYGMIRKHMASYWILAVKRIPGFWISSHSSVFGIDRPFSDYLRTKLYGPALIKGLLYLLHILLVLLAALGIFIGRKQWRRWAPLFIALLYYNMHILFDPCNRFLLPVMPLIFIFAAVFIVNFYDKIRFRTTL